MTVTSPLAGMTARPRTASIRARGPHRRLRTLVAFLLATGVAVSVGPVWAHAATPAPTPTPAAVDTGVTFTLSPVGNGIVAKGDPLTASLTVTNSTSLYVPSARVVLELGSIAFTDRATLQGWLDGDATGIATSPISTAVADAVDPEGSATVGVLVPADTKALQSLRPGVYPLLARYEKADATLLSTSAVIIPQTGGQATPVAVIVPITAGALQTGLATAAQLATLTAPGGSLSEQLDAVAGSEAILAVDPAIAAAIRVLGGSAPPDAVAWLQRLEALPNSRFALQFGDADVASQLASGLSTPLQPQSLQSYMTADDFPVPTTEPQPTPDATQAPVEPEYPDMQTLLDIGGGRSAVYWPVAGTADSATMVKLGALGTDGQPAVTIIPSSTTRIDTSGISARGVIGKDSADVLVYDSGISAALREASLTDENVLRGRPLAAATALLALASATAGDRPLLVTVDRATDRSQVALGAAIGVATALPTTTSSALGQLIASSPRAVTLTTTQVDTARVAAAAALRSDEGDVTAFATILEEPILLTGPERASMLQVLGAAWVPKPTEWRQAVADHRQATQKTLDSVGILPPSQINLATAGSSLPFWVRNDLPYPVRVILYATPDDLRLEMQRSNPVEAAAASNTRVKVPVQARIGSGEVTIELRLRSNTAVPIGSAQYVEINVRADWEDIGVGIIVALVGGFIALGLVRTVLRRRRARVQATNEESAEPSQAAEPDPAGTTSGADR